jgi:hypothetical protein
VERLGLTLIAHHAPPSQLLISDPLAPLDLTGVDGPPSPDLVLLLLVTSFGFEPYPLTLIPRRRSPSSLATHRLGSAVESHDPSARPLPDGVVRWTNRRSTRLQHGLLRFGGVPESEGSASLKGSAGDSPWCQHSLGMALWTDEDARRPTYHRRSNGAGDHRDAALIVFFFSSLILPHDGLMMRACGSVQPGWGNPNRGPHTVVPDDPMERRRGPRAPSAGTPAGLGKGMGATPPRGGVARPKAAVVVELQGRQLCCGGVVHHDDRDDGGMGWRPHAEAPRSDR